MANKNSNKEGRASKSRMSRLTPEQRSAVARKGGLARVAYGPKAEFVGTLKLGDAEIQCAVLPGGRRVLSDRAVTAALGRYKQSGARPGSQPEEQSGKMAHFMGPTDVISFASEELIKAVSVTTPYLHRHPDGQGFSPATGVAAELLPAICGVWVRAQAAGVLKESQQGTAQRAASIMEGLATVGITALVDEATGYQQRRDKDALQQILDRFLRTELAAWSKRFPDAFYENIFRLRGWTWRGMQTPKPHAVAHYTKEFVYARLAPGVLQELQTRLPPDARGRKSRFHQFLTADVGHPALSAHLHTVVALLKVAKSWDQFVDFMDRTSPKFEATMALEIMSDPKTD